MEALLQFDVSKATLIRGGQLRTADAALIVPGDIVRLDSGRRVPADARLIESSEFRTDEAALTGESLPVSKHADKQHDDGTSLADRRNMVYKGTTVTGGTALGVVTETGASTEIGRIGTLVGTIEEKRTPLERRLDLLAAAEKFGVDRSKLVSERPEEGTVPFSSVRKFMASFHREPGGLVAYAKGAPRRVLEMSEVIVTGDGVQPLDDMQRTRVMDMNDAMAREGLRVVALASGRVQEMNESAVQRLTFIGLVGFADPPANGVKEAIVRLRAAGLRTIMLTGDQRATAAAVGRELQLVNDEQNIIDGRELDSLSEAELNRRLPLTAAFSRITPEHKLRLVQALQARGDIVAMLGDGVNDAPALRQADIGVAMGIRGTDVAKEAAAIVLQDDRFDTVTAAVEEGRVIFDNILKFVFYLFSCNVAEVLLLLCAALAGLPMPLLPLQILWLNMVTDTFPALALALEPAEADVMARPPRDPREAILSRQFLSRVGFYSALITAASFAAFASYLDGPEARAQTVAFMTLAFAQLFHLGTARSDQPVFHLKSALANPYAVGAMILSIALQFVALHVNPLPRVLGLTPLSANDWYIILFFASIPAVVGQVIKVMSNRPPRIST